jgi:coenzyme F420-reducing hydrogenase beta subunit
MSEVIDTIRNTSQTYAIVGVPCFIKAIRLLAREDSKIRDRIKFCIGLTCGHFKSARFADMFAWQCGVAPSDLISIDFRVKLPGRDANNYGVKVIGLQNGREVQCTKINREFYGYLWGHGFFKYYACDYCDDVFAETADISFGDAWLEQYLKDYQGTNIVIIRNKLFLDLIERGITQGRLNLNDISASKVAKSQDAGLRHRRQGLSYRLYLKDKAGQWRPPKRVSPGFEHLNNKLRKIFVLREKMSQESHFAFDEALNKGSFNVFKSRMDKLLRKYNSLYGRTLWKRMSLRVKKIAKKVLSK